MSDSLRHHRHIASELDDRFGPTAERFARFFGTIEYLAVQTVLVTVWIALNVTAVINRWDPYPFILLNLIFSTQAAYAAPLILLAQNRAADRDRLTAEADAKHREELHVQLATLIQQNTELTAEIHQLVSSRHV